MQLIKEKNKSYLSDLFYDLLNIVLNIFLIL